MNSFNSLVWLIIVFGLGFYVVTNLPLLPPEPPALPPPSLPTEDRSAVQYKPGKFDAKPVKDKPAIQDNLGQFETVSLRVPPQVQENRYWRGEHSKNCVSQTEAPTTPDKIRLVTYIATIRQSDLGHRLLSDLADFGVGICLDDDFEIKDDVNGVYYSLYRAAVVRRKLDQNGRLYVLIHELRHAWQDRHDLFFQGLDLEQRLTMSFMHEADADAFAVAVSWELRRLGHSGAWDHVLQDRWRKPVAMAYQAMLEQQNVLPMGAVTDEQRRNAMRAAFVAWFNDEGADEYYARRLGRFSRGKPIIAVRSFGDVVNHVKIMGRLPIQYNGDAASYIDYQEITLAQRRAADRMDIVHKHLR